ncbi:MAG: peroxiredoxin [Phycisphaeraceae bacterium]
MALRLGETAPNFQADTTQGRIDFHDWLGNSWGILFSHPADYTPVCTTELGMAAKLSDDFAARNVKMIAVSVDPLDSHTGWINDINETQQCNLDYPIIADPDRAVATLYDMIHPEASEKATVRSVFIVGPDKKIKLTLTYPASTGRNFDELLRVIDSLQLTAEHKLATPVNWNVGEDAIIVPAVGKEEADHLFPGYREVKPYLRYTPSPKK